MWNEKAPLELLENMPKTLTEENLAKLQEIIDVDKYQNSCNLQKDLCGEYAPFCNGCDKWVKYPCARAYVKMMQSNGFSVEIGKEEAEPEKEEFKPIRIAIVKTKVVVKN